MDFQEPEHVAMIRDTLRRILAREASPEIVTAWDKADCVPRDMLEKIAALGLCGLATPESHGGTGRDILAVVAVIEELARRHISLAGIYIQNIIYGSMNILESGTAEQRDRLLPDLAAGKLMFAYGLSEPDVGADLASVTTRAERRGDKVVINGYKRWCTGAGVADYIYALVRSGPADQRYKNLSFVLIPPHAAGVSLTAIDTIGCHGLPTNDVAFDDVEVPFDNVIGGDAGWNNGWSLLAGPALEAEKLQLPALAIGIAHSAVAEAWEYSQQRKQFGKRICGHQAVRHALAEAQTKLQACRLMLTQAAWLVDQNLPSAAQTSMAKLYVAETAVEIVLSCQKVMGAYGYAEGFNMERYVRDILVMPIFGGSSAIQKNNIANLMKLPRE